MSTYGFLRWLRAGASAATATPRSAAATQERATFTAGIGLTDDLGGMLWPQRQLTLFGPGDVIGLDSRQVLRMEPAPNALDAQYEKFAQVEFDEPALPWLLTPFHEETSEPSGSTAQLVHTGIVLPWIALVVVTERAGVDLGYEPGALLPVLHVDDVTKELPDLNEAHAWAHVQVTGGLPATDTDFDQLLTGHPELSLSRLVCPRLLEPAKRYIACVVPVFKAGVHAGLGRNTAGVAAADLAYDATKPGPVDLPVFLTWSFTTASHAGFEALVRRLVPRTAGELAGVGQRALDVSDPGFGLSVRTGATVAVGGALRVPGQQPADAADDLRNETEQPADAADDLPNEIEQVVNRIDYVAPPLYGRWLAAVDQVPSGDLVGRRKRPGWVRQLNIEPRHRVAAGLGTQVIQAEQEALMAAAWDQLGDVLRANQLLRQAQLALAVGAQLHSRHLAPLTTYARLQVAGPALTRIRSADPTVTLHGVIEATCLPLVTLHASFRRLTRPRGPLARRAGRGVDVPRGFDTEALLDQLINGQLPATAPAPAGPTITLTTDERDQVIARLERRGPGQLATRRRAIAARLRHLAVRASPHSCSPPTDDPSARALDRLRPAVTIPPRVRAQIVLPATIAPVNAQLDAVLASPELTGAMYRSLIEVGQEWLLPGLEHVPANTVTALEADDAFIEAFLVGLNHEMGRELLWRGYPTDQRGTVLAHFWDLRRPSDTITLDPSDRDASRRPQISKIHTWRPTSGLGTHRPRSTPKIGLVLLLRGDLIRHFPRPGVVLAKAGWVRDAAGNVLRHPDGRAVRRPLPLAPETTEAPLFTGRLEPDVLFAGYAPSAEGVRGTETEAGDAGYFVLFSEQPTEPRFGLNESGAPPDAATGRLASWNDLVRSQVKCDLAGHLDLAATAAASSFIALMPTGTTTWDGRSDSLASILLSRPFRLYVHGSDLLPLGGAS